MNEIDRQNRAYALRSIGRWFLIGCILVFSHYDFFVTALAIAASQTTWRVREIVTRTPDVPHDTVFITVDSTKVKA